MSIADVTQFSLFVVLLVFISLCGFSLLRLLPRKRKGKTWSELVPHRLRFVTIRLGIAAGIGALLFLLVSAALTLDQERPPESDAPVISVGGSAGRTLVNLDLETCGDPATGAIQVSGTSSGTSKVTIESERDTSTPVPLDEKGIGRFTLSDPSSDRSVLSCYLQMPVIEGGSGYSISLGLGPGMEVDAFDSVPSPASYLNGRWTWNCEAGETCGVLVTASLAVEDAFQQVIVLVLASVFGAIIALLIGELVFEPVRRRLDRLKD